ncbi:nitroreductase family protein [Allopusillimonas ginsengisoli]|uniref:nitroreductase family protein n=1 Tax=Allopusillimonas ginsengisoli TaxID=453575 RepID=UPI001020BB63|nr:nitroreductase [Allopusillimonas ginsengisoli]TEA77663.1 nitroreductase [Allopusillimonas ginsengisoli]
MSVAPIDFLLSRRSVKFVQEPAPSSEELARILQSAMSAPDHGRLQPWRFKLIRGAAVGRLADTVFTLMEEAGSPIPPHKAEITRRWLSKVPLMLAVACKLDHANTKIPEEERMLATGAAVTNILNAVHMLGYAAYWSTGLGTYVDQVTDALGFDSLDYRFMGYIAIGTPIESGQAPERPDYHQFVSEWTGA